MRSENSILVFFLVDEKRRCLHHQIRPVLLILPTPNKLRVEVPIAPLVGGLDGTPVVIFIIG